MVLSVDFKSDHVSGPSRGRADQKHQNPTPLRTAPRCYAHECRLERKPAVTRQTRERPASSGIRPTTKERYRGGINYMGVCLRFCNGGSGWKFHDTHFSFE